MALKTRDLAVTEIDSTWRDVALAAADQNNTVNSLYVTHRNDPLRYEFTTGTDTPLDFRVGSRLIYTDSNQTSSIMKELGDDFQILRTFEVDPIHMGLGAYAINIQGFQLQKLIAGKIVTGPVITSTLATSGDVYTIFDACEIYPGMILIITQSSSGSSLQAYTYSYNATTLAMTFVSNTVIGNSQSCYGASLEKIVDGRAYYLTNSTATGSSSGVLSLLKVTVAGVITETFNVLGGGVFSNSSAANFVTMGPYVSPKLIARIALDSNTFALVSRDTSGYPFWTTVSFNTANDATTLIARTQYTGITLSPSSNIGLSVIGIPGPAGQKFIIVGSGASGIVVLTINAATSTTPIDTQFIGGSSSVFTGYITHRKNTAAKMAYFAIGQNKSLLTISWTDGVVAPTIKKADIGITTPFLALFNNIIYLTDINLYSNIYYRYDTDGNQYEIARIYNGQPRMDSPKIKWSKLYNCYIVAGGNAFYYFSSTGDLLGAQWLKVDAGPSVSHHTHAFDITPKGEIVGLGRQTTTSVYSRSTTYRYFRFTPNINSQGSSVTPTIYSTIGTDSTGTGIHVNDLVWVPDFGIIFIGPGYSDNAGAAYIYVYYVSAPTSSAQVNATSLGTANLQQTGSNFGYVSDSYRCRIVPVDNKNFAFFVTNVEGTIVTANVINVPGTTDFSSIALKSTSNTIFNYIQSASPITPPLAQGKIRVFDNDPVTGFSFQDQKQSSDYIFINGVSFKASKNASDLYNLTVGRIGSYAVVLEEYLNSKVFRIFNETNGTFASEVVTQTYTEPYNNPNYTGTWYLNAEKTDLFYSGSTRKFNFKSPGSIRTKLRLSILKSDGTTRVPVLFDYFINVGETFVLPPSNPIYLSSGSRLQVSASAYWQLSLSGMQIIRPNVV